MSSTLSALTAARARWLIVAAIAFTVATLVGVDVHNEMIPALEQCGPSCEVNG